MLEDLRKYDKSQFEAVSGLIREQQQKGSFPTAFAMPLGVQYELTASCNLKCLHCYNDSGGSDKKTTMQLQDWLSLTRELIDSGGVFNIILSGGEPLLIGEGLLEIMDLFATDGTPITLITNGFLLDEGWVSSFSRYKDLILRLSIDGSTEVLHDGLRQVPGSFRRVVRAAGLCSGAGIPFDISTCVTPESLGSLEEMVRLADGLGARSLGLEMVLFSGRAVKNRHLALSREQQELLAKKFVDLMGKYTLPISYGTGYYAVQYHLSGFPCKNLVVRPDGNVRLTCNAPFIVGNVQREPIADIWKEKAVKAWRHPEVVRFLEGVDQITAEYDGLANHCDKDILL
ncbi:MAG: radical SAM protein [Desulfocucumaceae bacterium]